MALNLVQGWTEQIQDTLFADGVVQDLTGMTVQLVMYNSGKKPVTLLGDTVIVNASEGVVGFNPATTDLLKGVYSIRWKVTDPSDRVAFFPSGSPEVWTVQLP